MSTGSNLAFYRKYRPKTFEDIVGQEYVVQTLKNAVVAGTPAHAYLFTGSRGTGKTSVAKILAKALNCPNQTHGNPCLTCPICLGVDDGSVMDIMEIDAASNNGVDNIRDLREQAQFMPAVGRYRVYIIDEVHMLSIGAFNALLKIMEEPPAHVIFILATTEVHKIPATIISRCQRFDFKRIPADQIADHLINIAQKEGLTLTRDAAVLIATLADGGLRDSISILDKSASVSEMLDYQTVAKIVGIAGVEHLFKISDYIGEQNVEGLLLIVNELAESSLEPQRLIEQLIEHFRSLMVTLTVKNAQVILNTSPDNLQKLKSAAEKYTVSQIIYIQSCLQQSLNKMQKTVNKKAELELLLIKLCSPKLETSVEALTLRIEQLEKMLENGAYTFPVPAAQEPKPPHAVQVVAKKAETPPKTNEYKFEVPDFVKNKPQNTTMPKNEYVQQAAGSAVNSALQDQPHEITNLNTGFSDTPPWEDAKKPNVAVDKTHESSDLGSAANPNIGFADTPPWEDDKKTNVTADKPHESGDLGSAANPNIGFADTTPWEDAKKPNVTADKSHESGDLVSAENPNTGFADAHPYTVDTQSGSLPENRLEQSDILSANPQTDDVGKNVNMDVPPPEDNSIENIKQPFIAWDSALEKLKVTNGALYGALLGSRAYVTQKHVLIDCKDTLFLVMMRENEYAKESLKKCIFEVTGQKYNIGPYKAPQTPKSEEKEDPLQKFVESLASLPDDIVEIK